MKTRSTSASHSLEGQGTKSTTVKWSIVLLTCESTVKEFWSEWSVQGTFLLTLLNKCAVSKRGTGKSASAD